MGELARRRQSRDLWISRSHVRAVAALIVVLTAASFLLGYVIGREHAVPPPAPPPDEALVDLLARIEANARPDAAVEELTFPEVLKEPVPEVAPPAPAAPEAFVAQIAVATEADARTAEEALRAAGLSPEAAADPTGTGWRVVVGRWPTAEAAAQGVTAVNAAGYDAVVVRVP